LRILETFVIHYFLQGVGSPLRAGGLVGPARNAFGQTRDSAAMLMLTPQLLFNPQALCMAGGYSIFSFDQTVSPG
jgi:hypothetical protein